MKTIKDWMQLPFLLGYLALIIVGSGILYSLNGMGLMDL